MMLLDLPFSSAEPVFLIGGVMDDLIPGHIVVLQLFSNVNVVSKTTPAIFECNTVNHQNLKKPVELYVCVYIYMLSCC